ncbi:MAG TPA: (deoxy)nucleoside triphosphate pyrophosphohydrolase [Candidatus Acidoferrum sp.]|nr:(deoxy)nucleoside triphosphate pyrophosphohydrolase [Candidatus Acidoferrum sp.]
MRTVVAAIIERSDHRLLIGQRRKDDSSPLKWEFPGGKVEHGETPEAALRRELREELGAILTRAVEIARVQHRYAAANEVLDIIFFGASIASEPIQPRVFEKTAWVLPRELGNYDFLAANAQLIALLATGKIKPSELLEKSA